MKTKIKCVCTLMLVLVLLLVAVGCASAPTATPVPPTQPPAPTPTLVPPTPNLVPMSNLNPTISAMRTEAAATAQAKISAATQEMSGLGVGTKAPDFTLMDATGRPVSLAEQVAKHKSVVLVFYRGDW